MNGKHFSLPDTDRCLMLKQDVYHAFSLLMVYIACGACCCYTVYDTVDRAYTQSSPNPVAYEPRSVLSEDYCGVQLNRAARRTPTHSKDLSPLGFLASAVGPVAAGARAGGLGSALNVSGGRLTT